MRVRESRKGRKTDRASLDLPAALTALASSVHEALPEAAVSFDRPEKPQGEWWIDIKCNGFATSLSWSPALGFGIFTDEPVYGERPDELYRRPDLVARRLGLLCDQWRTSRSVAPLWLAEVRKLTGTPQTTLAATLERKQPALSKLETREDVKLSTLAAYVEAMGGRLEMRVHFKDWDATIALPEALHKP
jgi:hypothetical protein